MPDLTAVAAFLDLSHIEQGERMADFAAREIATLRHPRTDEDARAQAREILGILGRGDWYEPIANRDLRACALMRETLAEVSPLADAIFALQALATVPMLLDGGPARDRWLDPVRRGEAMGAFAMTEPEAGSDVASIQTTAMRDGDGYVINGRKTFISNAGIADFYTVFATIDPVLGKKGITCFVIPADTPGLAFGGAQVLSAPHPLGDIVFTDCRVPLACRLGEEGGGLRLGLATLDELRATVGAAACGMGRRALDEATRHAMNRRQFGEPLTSFQLIQDKLARMAIDLTAARLLVYRAAWVKDGGAARVTTESAMAKAFATEAAQRVVDSAVQILGGRGVLADHPVDLLYRSVRALRIYEGTTEIQHLVIANDIIKRFPGGAT